MRTLFSCTELTGIPTILGVATVLSTPTRTRHSGLAGWRRMCRALQSMPLLMRRRSQTGSGRPCRCRIASTTFSIRLSMRASLEILPITLICHSLGGLIIKQVMLSLKEQEDRRPEASVLLNRIRQIVFIATPHTGARSATWLARASFLVWPTATARALVSNDPYLRKVNVSYRGSRASGEHGFRIGSISKLSPYGSDFELLTKEAVTRDWMKTRCRSMRITSRSQSRTSERAMCIRAC